MQTRTLWRRLAVALVVACAAAGAVAQNNQSLGETDIRTIFADKPGIRNLIIPEEMTVSQFPGAGGTLTARNTTGATIAADRVVYVSGTAVDPETGITLPLITLASQSGATAERTRGFYVTLESIATATNGRVAKYALSSTAPIDLAAGTQGDPIYLGLTGLPTRTMPTGANMAQEVGTIGVVATDVIAWDLTASEFEVHTHADQAEGNQLTPSVFLADDAFTATDVSTAGAGGKFAVDAITEAGVDHLFGDDSINAEDFVAGAGGIVAPDAIDEVAVDNIFADNAINAEDFAGGAGGIFDVDCIADGAAWQNLGAAGSLTTAALAELVADDALSGTEVSTSGAGGKFAADAITEAGVDHLFADDSWNAEDFAVGAGGIVDANVFDEVNVDHLFGDDSWNAEDFAVGAGGIVDASAFDEANVDHLFGDDSMNAEDFAVGAGGIVDADAFDEVNVDHLFGDDSINAEDFVAGAGGIFAAGALDNTAIANVVADDAFTTVEFGAGAGGKFAAGALDEAGVDNLLADDSINAEDFVAGAGGIFAPSCLDATAVTNVFAANAFTEGNVDQAVAQSAIDDDRLKAIGATRMIGGRDEGRACVGYVYLTGVVADGEQIVLNSRTYEFDTNAAIVGDVTVDVTADQTADAACTALVAALNADASRVVNGIAWTGNSDATSGVTLTAIAAQATNYTVTESMVNGDRSGATLTGAAVAANRSLWAYRYTITAADVTSLAGAGGDEVVIGAVTSTTAPILISVFAQDSAGLTKTLANVGFRWVQPNTNFWALVCEDAGAVLANTDVIGFIAQI